MRENLRAPRSVETPPPSPEPPTPLLAGIPRNETRTFCSAIPVTREISFAGCTNKVTMNYCSGSCGTFAL